MNMKPRMLLVRWTGVAIAAAMAYGVPLLAQAQTADLGTWHAALTLYAYAPSLYGETTFPSGTAGPTFKIDAHSIIKNLNFAFMGKLHVQRGPWGGTLDVFHADISDRVNATHDFSVPQVPVPVGITGDFGLKSQTTLLTLAGTWQFVATSERSLRMVFGARVYHTPQQLEWRLSAALPGFPALSGTSNVARTNWDAIIGFSGRQRFGSDLRWFMPWYVDAGAGDSRFTGQALLGIGYAFDWGDVAASWRYIDYVFKPGSLISRVAYSGPAVGLTWRF